MKLSIEITGDDADDIRKRLAAIISTSEVKVADELGEVVDMKVSLNFKKDRLQRLVEKEQQ